MILGCDNRDRFLFNIGFLTFLRGEWASIRMGGGGSWKVSKGLLFLTFFGMSSPGLLHVLSFGFFKGLL